MSKQRGTRSRKSFSIAQNPTQITHHFQVLLSTSGNVTLSDALMTGNMPCWMLAKNMEFYKHNFLSDATYSNGSVSSWRSAQRHSTTLLMLCMERLERWPCVKHRFTFALPIKKTTTCSCPTSFWLAQRTQIKIHTTLRAYRWQFLARMWSTLSNKVPNRIKWRSTGTSTSYVVWRNDWKQSSFNLEWLEFRNPCKSRQRSKIQRLKTVFLHDHQDLNNTVYLISSVRIPSISASFHFAWVLLPPHQSKPPTSNVF